MGERLQVSNSMLQTVCDCPTRVVLRLLGRTGTEPNASLECGRRVHEVLANYLRGMAAVGAELFAPITVAYRAWCEQNITSEDRRWWSNVLAICEEWVERHPINELPFTIDSSDDVEIEFVYPLGEAKDGTPIDIIGNLDGIGRDKQTKNRRVIEHKTTGKLDTKFIAGFEYDPQNTEYLWAASETLGEPVYASYINAIQIHTLPSGEPPAGEEKPRRCKTHHKTYDVCRREHVKANMFPVTRIPDDIDAWKQNALILAERVLKLARLAKRGDEAATRTPVLGRFSDACGMCEFKTWCLTNNRQLSLIDVLAPKAKPRELSDDKLRSGLVEV